MIYNPILNTDILAKNLLPVHQRKPNWESWISGLLNGTKRSKRILDLYLYGSVALYYNSATSYNVDSEVVYKRKVYLSLYESNLNNTPDTNPLLWECVCQSFLGLDERSKYSCTRIILEYALNRFFSYELSQNGYAGFKQPGYGVSSIWIDNTAISYTSFVSYTSESNTSDSYTDHTSGYSFTNTNFASANTYSFNIHFPVPVSVTIGTSDYERTIRNFVDKYVASGIQYQIILY